MKTLWISSWRFLSWIFPQTIAHWAELLFLTPQRTPRPNSENSYYDSARKFYLSNGIAAFEWGPSVGAPLVVLVHGWSGRGTQMGAFAAPLVNRGFRVVALDGPAHGDTPGKMTNVGEYSRFLIEAQKDLGAYEALIAHSFGAGCSVLSAQRGMRVKKLVLIAGPSRYEAVVKYYLERIKLSSRAKKYFYASLEKRVGLAVEDMNIGKMGAALSQVEALIIHDKGDKEVGYSSALEMHQNWPRSQLLTVTGLGHRRILKDPKVVESALEFILSRTRF